MNPTEPLTDSEYFTDAVIAEALRAGFKLSPVTLDRINRTRNDAVNRVNDCPRGLVTGLLSRLDGLNTPWPRPSCSFVRPGWMLAQDCPTNPYVIAAYKRRNSSTGALPELEWIRGDVPLTHPDYTDSSKAKLVLVYHTQPLANNSNTWFTWERPGNVRTLRAKKKIRAYEPRQPDTESTVSLHPQNAVERSVEDSWWLWLGSQGELRGCHNPEHDKIMAKFMANPNRQYRQQGQHLFEEGDQIQLLDPNYRPPVFFKGDFKATVTDFHRLYPDKAEAKSALSLSSGTELSAQEFFKIFSECLPFHKKQHPSCSSLEFPTGFLSEGYGSKHFAAPVIQGEVTILAKNLCRDNSNYGKVDHSATVSTGGTLSDPHVDYGCAAPQLIIVPDDEEHGKTWFLWKATKKNHDRIKSILVDSSKSFGDGSILHYMEKLDNLVVRFARPGHHFVIPAGVIHAVMGTLPSCHIGCRILSTRLWPETRENARTCLELYRKAYVSACAWRDGELTEFPGHSLTELQSATNHWELACFVGEWLTLARVGDDAGNDKGKGASPLREGEGDVFVDMEKDIMTIFDSLAEYCGNIKTNVSVFNSQNSDILTRRLSFFRARVFHRHRDISEIIF